MLLAQPISVNGLAIANRIVMPPMATYKAADGLIGAELFAWYAARAEAGTGLIIVEHSSVDARGRVDTRQISVADDTALPGLARLAESVHRAGPSRLFAQLNHAGSQRKKPVPDTGLVSASAVPHPALDTNEVPRALTVEEIQALVARFAQAAARVRQAGFDGVEIHAAHGYLLNQFYSPLTNRRSDDYGGQSLNTRLRFLLETVEAVRRVVGRDFPLAVRLGGADYMPGGSSIEDAVAAAHCLEQAGVDLLDISGGMCRYTRAGHDEAGWFADMSLAIRQAVSVPVLLTGGIQTAAQAEELLHKGAADLLGVGRAMLRNAAWSRDALKPHAPLTEE